MSSYLCDSIQIKNINNQTHIIDEKRLRNVAGAFATGVTVCCIEDKQGQVKGLTANSFVSISLSPPIVMVSIQNDSTFLNSCVIGKKLGISILSTEQKNMSDHFAGMQKSDGPISFVSHKNCHILDNSLAWYETTIREIILAGDHHIILCGVDDLGKNEDAEPLIYYSGYLTLGKELS